MSYPTHILQNSAAQTLFSSNLYSIALKPLHLQHAWTLLQRILLVRSTHTYLGHTALLQGAAAGACMDCIFTRTLDAIVLASFAVLLEGGWVCVCGPKGAGMMLHP